MKAKIVLLRTLAIITLVITILEIRQTYAVFYSEMSGKSGSSIGKWNIEINNTNISSGVNNNFEIDSLVIESNSNVKAGKLAPGTLGSFNLIINPTNTNVSIKYDITIDKSNLSNSNIKFDSIDEIADDGVDLVRTGESTYTGIIKLSKINGNYLNNVKICFSWNNDEQNNEKDSIIGSLKNNKLNIPINVSITQYLGENIVPYSGI